MHNIAKHIIYVQEATTAALQTLNRMSQCHSRARPSDSLIYTETLFTSTSLRLNSLEKRMQNLINLSFNLVTQQDSRVMQKDSSSMKTIAVMTLIFLPASTVAAAFGSSFFNLSVDEEGVQHFIVNKLFWIFWVISLPLTVALVGAWRWWHTRMEDRFIHSRTKLGRVESGLSTTTRL
jgi:Mg2+ and Co2+ transporter CorA